jgi:hypothetical protein
MTATSFEPEILFHIGFHKTGTTWMQRRVFVPQQGFQRVMSHREVRELISGPNRLDFDPGPARSLLTQRRQPDSQTATRQFVVSSELLCGNPFSGNREAADFAHRIREISRSAKILITVREQLSMITSTYSEYISRGGTLTIRQFLDRPPLGFEGFDPNSFRYDRLVDLYQQLFGPSQVCVIAHEAVRAQRLDELNRLRSFCNLEPLSQLEPSIADQLNTSAPTSALGVNRRLNHLRRSAATPNPLVNLRGPARILSKATENLMRRRSSDRRDNGNSISAVVSSRFSDHYRESNCRLQELVGSQFDVTGLGYQT